MNNIGMVSDERRKAYEHVARSLALRYDTIYYVDVSSSAYIVFSSTDAYRELELSPSGSDYFTEIRRRLEEIVHPEDRSLAALMTWRDELPSVVNRERVVYTTFRVLFQGTFIYMNCQAMWADDGRHLIVGFKDVDAWERRRRDAEARTQVYSQIALTLAHRYEGIYYVDLEDESCIRFAVKSDGDSRKVTGEHESFFELARRQVMQAVHPADRDRMEPLMNREALLDTIDIEGVLSITVRAKRDGHYIYVNFRCMRAEDDRYLIVAMSDVDKKVRHKKAQEKAMRDAEHRAMRDELTRVRNKNAYAEMEDELQKAIDEGRAEPLAIVMCDVNDLKGVNDGQGHLAGDALLQEACKLICSTYAHSPVFRVGGDEFVAILRGEDYERRQELLGQMRGQSREHLQDGGAVVAVGMSDYQKDTYITDVFERADREMYEDKRALKGEA